MTYTTWYPKDTVPGEVGVYQTCSHDDEMYWWTHGYQYWNGEFWGLYNCTPDQALAEGYHRSTCQDNYWRGLQDEPE